MNSIKKENKLNKAEKQYEFDLGEKNLFFSSIL
jgi:hypothetical protein